MQNEFKVAGFRSQGLVNLTILGYTCCGTTHIDHNDVTSFIIRAELLVGGISSTILASIDGMKKKGITQKQLQKTRKHMNKALNLLCAYRKIDGKHILATISSRTWEHALKADEALTALEESQI
jgi:hypothetical protein